MCETYENNLKELCEDAVARGGAVLLFARADYLRATGADEVVVSMDFSKNLGLHPRDLLKKYGIDFPEVK